MAITIKRRVNLDFLGEAYKDSYLEFYVMPLAEYEEFTKKLVKTSDQSATRFILDGLKSKFLSGKINQDGQLKDMTVEDLDSLDAASIIKLFDTYTWVNPDPKA